MHVVESNAAKVGERQVVDIGDHVRIPLDHDRVNILLSPHLLLLQRYANYVLEDVAHCAHRLHTPPVIPAPNKVGNRKVLHILSASILKSMSHFPCPRNWVMHPRTLEINWQFLEHIRWHKKILVFDVNESFIHPHKVVRLEDIVWKGLGHEEQFREEDRVVEFELVLDVLIVELVFRNGQMIVDNLFHFCSVPLLLKPIYFFINKQSVGPVAVFVNKDL